jgi:hypothetical protein
MRFVSVERVSGETPNLSAANRGIKRNSTTEHEIFGSVWAFWNSLVTYESHSCVPTPPGDLSVKRRVFCIAGLVTALVGLVFPGGKAQEKNEVGLVIGATITPARNFSTGTASSASFNPSLVLGAEYDRRFFGGERIGLSGGLDFVASPLDVKISNPPPALIGQYAYIFLTPHVRLKFNPRGSLSPWVLLGGGYARFLEKRPTAVPSFVPGTRTILRVFHIPIGFRAEVRDFYSGSPNYSQPVKGDLQHNVVFTGGLLIKFGGRRDPVVSPERSRNP